MASFSLKAFAAIVVIIAAIALYGIYTGHRSSNEAIQYALDAARAAGDTPLDASITEYRDRGHNTYTCGAVRIKGNDGENQYRLFVVIQTGPLLNYLGTHYQGEKTFEASYTEHCM